MDFSMFAKTVSDAPSRISLEALAIVPITLALLAASAPAALATVRTPDRQVQIADLQSTHWASNAIRLAVANNIMALEGARFNGNRPLSHPELRQALSGMLSLAEETSGKPGPLPLRAEIDGLVGANGNVTRGEVSRLMARFLDTADQIGVLALGAPRQHANFVDAGADAGAIAAVVDKYLVMTGFPDDTFRPDQEMSRYQMAAVAQSVLKNFRSVPVVAEPTVITRVIVQPAQVTAPAPAPVAVADTGRRNFRANLPAVVTISPLNRTNAPPTGATMPFSAQFIGYNGPVMLQNVSSYLYGASDTNVLDSEFRIGFPGLKAGIFQAIPYVGTSLGLGISSPGGGAQYDGYAGGAYGTILSILPFESLELHGQVGQSALLAGTRWGANAGPLNPLGTFLTSYGASADWYITSRLAISVGVSSWQQPSGVGTTGNVFGAPTTTLGGNIGAGYAF